MEGNNSSYKFALAITDSKQKREEEKKEDKKDNGRVLRDILTPACIPANTSTSIQRPAYQQSRFLWSDIHPG